MNEHRHSWTWNTDWNGGPSETGVWQCMQCNATGATELDLPRLAQAVKALICDFNWQSENVRVVLGPIPYGPGPWTIGGNPDGNIALAIVREYEKLRPTTSTERMQEAAE